MVPPVQDVQHPGTDRPKELDSAAGAPQDLDVAPREALRRAHSVQDDSHLDAVACSLGQHVAEPRTDLVAPEDVGLQVH